MGEKLPPLNACYNTTNFENKSYQEMLNMVRGVDATAIMARGTALIDAQTEIEKIGTELKEHVGRTTWKGAGGDAFREWGDGFAKETLKLADYAGTAGTSLQTAGQALSEVAKVVQGHPDAVEMCYADEAKEKARLKAVETARNEAIPQMNKLASYYLMAEQSISMQEEPNFQPLPRAALPDTSIDSWQKGLGSGGVTPEPRTRSQVLRAVTRRGSITSTARCVLMASARPPRTAPLPSTRRSTSARCPRPRTTRARTSTR